MTLFCQGFASSQSCPKVEGTLQYYVMPKLLQEYFAPNGRMAAWDAYSKFAGETDWSVPNKMNLYEASTAAFGGRADDAERFAMFEEIYSNLKSYWQVFRSPRGDDGNWNARTIFDTVEREFSDFGWDSGVTMLTSLDSDKKAALLKSLHAMADIKANRGYPTMAVSKFLHFYNPTLFPIYDTTVIGERALKCFDAEYASFCADENLDYKAVGALFLENYILWGGSMLSAAGPDYMSQFIEWLREELPPKQFKRMGESLLKRLHATAFEFTLIGGAVAEGH